MTIIFTEKQKYRTFFSRYLFKPCTEPYLPVKDLLGPVNDTFNVFKNKTIANLAEIVQESNDMHFFEDRQKKCVLTAVKGVKFFNCSDLL